MTNDFRTYPSRDRPSTLADTCAVLKQALITAGLHRGRRVDSKLGRAVVAIVVNAHRQGKARQGKARRGKARQGEARRGKARRVISSDFNELIIMCN